MDEETAEQAAIVAQDNNEESAARKKKARSSEQVTTSAKPAATRSRKPNSSSPTTGSRRHTDSEKSAKLAAIKSSVDQGATLKAAVKDNGISIQTYYQWKRAAATPIETDAKPEPQETAFADLVELEKENRKLRKLLAEKLHAENAELRKRLGIR